MWAHQRPSNYIFFFQDRKKTWFPTHSQMSKNQVSLPKFYFPLAAFIAAQASVTPSAGETAPSSTLVNMSPNGAQ